jgi:hypothetical protein
MWAHILTYGALFGVAAFGYTIRNGNRLAGTGMLFAWVIVGILACERGRHISHPGAVE